MPTPKPPKNLGEAGQALWDATLEVAPDLNPAELTILKHACREEDLIDRIHDELENDNLRGTGYNGQEIANPFIPELRQHRATQATLLAKLKIPDTPASIARKKAVVSESARKAARSRWGSGTGVA